MVVTSKNMTIVKKNNKKAKSTNSVKSVKLVKSTKSTNSKNSKNSKNSIKSKKTVKSTKTFKLTKKDQKSNNYDYSPYIIALHEMVKNYENSYENSRENQSGLSPMSGSEPQWDPSKWNDRPKVKYTHNCYAYVLDQIFSQRQGKPQPGYFANFPPLTYKDYQCIIFYKRLKKDMPSMYLTNFDDRCKKGFYKGFIALDNKSGDQDYHFYRQDSTGYFSHKPGRTEAINYDASGKKIINPATADRKYPNFNYNKPCFFFCLNTDLSKAHSRSSFT